jgi:hypothetical protein
MMTRLERGGFDSLPSADTWGYPRLDRGAVLSDEWNSDSAWICVEIGGAGVEKESPQRQRVYPILSI